MLPGVKRRLRGILADPRANIDQVLKACTLIANYAFGSPVSRSVKEVAVDQRIDATTRHEPVNPMLLAQALTFLRSPGFAANPAEHAPTLIEAIADRVADAAFEPAQPADRVADADDAAFEPAVPQGIRGDFRDAPDHRPEASRVSKIPETTSGIVPENFSDSRPDWADEVSMASIDPRFISDLQGGRLIESFAEGWAGIWQIPGGGLVLHNGHETLARNADIEVLRQHAKNLLRL